MSDAPGDVEIISYTKATLFVAGLDESRVNQEVLLKVFGSFGEVRHISLPLHKNSHVPRGFAFVEFADYADAKEAAENLDGSELLGRTLVVNFAKQLAS